MFVGRMFFTLKSARDLPNQPGIKDVQPYLVIKVDNVEMKRIGYKENPQVDTSSTIINETQSSLPAAFPFAGLKFTKII